MAQIKDLDATARKYAKASFDDFRILLAMPNDAHYPKDIEINVKWAEQNFGKRGFKTKL